MPYIKPEYRMRINTQIDQLVDAICSQLLVGGDRDGTLNYAITRLINRLYPVEKYSDYNAAIGVLECAKAELYRRRVAPFEDDKINYNGDVRPDIY